MSILDGKYGALRNNAFGKTKNLGPFVEGTVVFVGNVDVRTDDNKKRKKDERFNADKHIIKVKIPGKEYDDDVTEFADLPNCLPFLPKHFNFTPRDKEKVLVIIPDGNTKGGDRYYVGPFISSETKFGGDFVDGTATANRIDGTTDPSEDIDRITTAKGLYENPKYIVIDGRNNTDIIQRDAEILIRAGKFVQNDPKQFNKENPGYFQIKYNQTFNEQKLNGFGVGDGELNNTSEKNVTVTNIVSNKINLLTYDDKNTYDLTYVDETSNGAAQYINEEEMDKILNTAHPLVFGDKLIEYLKLLKEAVTNHVHQINSPPSKNEGSADGAMFNFIKRADELEKAMLSKNIRIN
jgi:hypothetical protein